MKVLFVCQSNTGRSQMAAAFFQKLTKKHQAMDAGIAVGEREGTSIHLHVIECMKELGFDLSKNVRKQLTPEVVEEADKIVVMEEEQKLPTYLKNSPKTILWNVEDPKGTSLEFHRKIRDQLKKLVGKLVKEVE